MVMFFLLSATLVLAQIQDVHRIVLAARNKELGKYKFLAFVNHPTHHLLVLRHSYVSNAVQHTGFLSQKSGCSKTCIRMWHKHQV